MRSGLGSGTSGITVRPITGTFGAELLDADLRDETLLSALPSLLVANRVLIFRHQDLSAADQVRVAQTLGTPTPAHPVVPGLPDHPEVLELDAAQGGRNARWHTDVTFVRTPPAASVLVAREVPVSGGDTLWADLGGAYARLAPALQELVIGLRAVHRISPLAYWGEPFDTGMTRDDAAELLERANGVPPVIHPVVRVHPITGERILFVNPGFTSHVVGLSRVESDGILELLYEHATQPELVLRHRWEAGDVVIWDNRATMHYATDDYGDTPRRVHRVTLHGDVPVGPDGFESEIVDDPLLAIR